MSLNPGNGPWATASRLQCTDPERNTLLGFSTEINKDLLIQKSSQPMRIYCHTQVGCDSEKLYLTTLYPLAHPTAPCLRLWQQLWRSRRALAADASSASVVCSPPLDLLPPSRGRMIAAERSKRSWPDSLLSGPITDLPLRSLPI